MLRNASINRFAGACALALRLAALVFLSACGAGSGTGFIDSSLAPPPGTQTPAPATAPTSTPTAPPSTLTPTPQPSPTSTGISHLMITSGQPPSGVVGTAYGNSHTLWTCIPASSRCDWVPSGRWFGFELSANQPYVRIGTGTSIRWSWSSPVGSSLPPGLMISNPVVSCGFGGRCDCGRNGCGYAPAIVGTPTAAGTYHVIVTVTGRFGSPPPQASATYTITIAK